MTDDRIQRDELRYPDATAEELSALYRSGRMAGVPVLELRRQRAYRVDQANDLVRAAMKAGRGLTAEEQRTFDSLVEEAALLAPVLSEAEEAGRQQASKR